MQASLVQHPGRPMAPHKTSNIYLKFQGVVSQDFKHVRTR